MLNFANTGRGPESSGSGGVFKVEGGIYDGFHNWWGEGGKEFNGLRGEGWNAMVSAVV
jgi:hypothetical protein